MNCSNVLFDLDGTLIDSGPSILNALSKAFDNKGVHPLRSLTNELIGPPLGEIIGSLVGVEKTSLVNDIIDEFKKEYDETFCLHGTLYPGVRGVLKELVRRDIRLFVVTNKRAYPTQKILIANDLIDFFEGVYSPDSLSPPVSSKSDLLRNVIAMNRINQTNSVYVGDRSEDLLAAQANGLNFHYAQWGYGDKDVGYQTILKKPYDILANCIQNIA
jgi:phosphoglycolate phosphatase